MATADRYDRTFDELYAEFGARVLAYSSRRTRSLADAEDVAAETFVVAWRRLDDAPANVLPWLYGIARRTLANQRRANQRRISLLARLALHRSAPPMETTPTDNPALEALARMRPDDQELLRLVAWEGLDHAEISSVIGISVNAVAIRLHRARQRFARILAEISGIDAKGSGSSRTCTRWWTGTTGSSQKEKLDDR